jgi:hypothetical protein
MKTKALLSAALIIASSILYFSKPSRSASSEQIVDDSTRVGTALSTRLTDAYRQKDWAKLEALVAPDYSGITEDFEWNFASLKREFPKIQLTGTKIERQRVKRLAPDLILVNESSSTVFHTCYEPGVRVFRDPRARRPGRASAIGSSRNIGSQESSWKQCNAIHDQGPPSVTFDRHELPTRVL